MSPMDGPACIVNMFAVLSDSESFDKMDIVQTTEPMESIPPSISKGTNQHAAREEAYIRAAC